MDSLRGFQSCGYVKRASFRIFGVQGPCCALRTAGIAWERGRWSQACRPCIGPAKHRPTVPWASRKSQDPLQAHTKAPEVVLAAAIPPRGYPHPRFSVQGKQGVLTVVGRVNKIAIWTPNPLCDIPSGCCSFTGPWTVTRSSLRMLRRVAAFCRPLRPVLLLVSFPRSRSPVVGVLGLCWMRRDVPFACQWRPIVGVLRMCWLLPGSFDCVCCPHTSVHRPSIACLAVFLCGPGALFPPSLSYVVLTQSQPRGEKYFPPLLPWPTE